MRRRNQADREAFEAEMLPHLEAAYRLARALSRRTEDAQDLVQEAYLRAFAGFDSYQRGTNARAWLLTIVRRVYLNQWRRMRARPQLLPLAGPEQPEEPVDTMTPSVEDEALQQIERRQVLNALAELPEPFRSVLALVDLDGMHYAEAAEVLGCPIGTIMSRLHRGRLELARRLQSTLFGDEAG